MHNFKVKKETCLAKKKKKIVQKTTFSFKIVEFKKSLKKKIIPYLKKALKISIFNKHNRRRIRLLKKIANFLKSLKLKIFEKGKTRNNFENQTTLHTNC